MKQLIIGKRLDYAVDNAGSQITTVSQIMDLADGAVAAIDIATGTIITSANMNTLSPKQYEIVAKYGDKIVKSPMIEGKIGDYNSVKYADPQGKEVFVGDDGSTNYGFNFPAAIEEGMDFSLQVILPDRVGHRVPAHETFSVTAGATDTYQTVLTELVNKINANSQYVTVSTVTAGGNITGLKFVANDPKQNFEVAKLTTFEDSDLLEYQSVNGVFTATYTTPAQYTHGANYDEQMIKDEKNLLAEAGYTTRNTAGQNLWSEASRVETGVKYQRLIRSWQNQRDNVPSMKTTYQQEVQVWIPDGCTALTELDAIMSAY